MASPIIAGLVNLLGSSLNAEVWDGETPRYDAKGNPINPESQLGVWPGLNVMMDKGGAKRKRMFRGEYIDVASVNIQVWGTERGQEERLAKSIDVVLQQSSSWDQLTSTMQALDSSVIRVIHSRLDTWSSTQEPELRTAQSKYLYLGDIKIEVRVHGKKRV